MWRTLPRAFSLWRSRARLKNQKHRLCAHKQWLSASKILVNREIDLRFSPCNRLLLVKNPEFSLFSNKP